MKGTNSVRIQHSVHVRNTELVCHTANAVTEQPH